jgi:ABC-2 type transport system permease protein
MITNVPLEDTATAASTTAASSTARWRGGPGRASHDGSVWRSWRRLLATEAKLFVREPVGLIFVFAFPALTVLILGGVFDADDPAFGGAEPSDYYIAAYIGVVLCAVALIMLPVHLASYRERGVLRRYDASHFPPWALPSVWFAVATVLSGLAIAVLIGTGWLVYGVPAVDDPAATVLAVGLSVLTSISLGILLGMVLPTARAAQGVGLALFFPSFLLGGAGPPPDAMPSVMEAIANLLPMTHAVRAVQHPWLSIGGSTTANLAVLSALLVASSAAWLTVALRSSAR